LVKKAILFDLYGTLIHNTRNGAELLELALRRDYDFLRTRGCNVYFERFKQIDARVFTRLQNRKEETSQEIDLRTAYEEILPEVGVPASDEIIEGSIVAFGSAYEGVWELWPDVNHVLKALREKGYALAIVSDAQAVYARRDLRQLGILDHFDAIVFSSEVGWAKPHRLMFLTALEKLMVDASKAVMVGDTFDEDIVGAKKMELKAVLINRTTEQHSVIGVQPDRIISNLQELIECVDGLISL
jgi:HAD superfamily hydrolase (TIGR01509 family)